MPDPLKDLAGFDWEAFEKEAEAAAGDEGRALAENIARNLTESIRQTRNELEAGVDSELTSAELGDATDLDLAPRRERNLEASFETHMRGLFRRVGMAVGRKLNAQQFMGVYPDGRPAIPLSREAAHAQGFANLGPHPHSQAMAVPIPPGYEDASYFAGRLAHLPKRDQTAWLARYKQALESDEALPPFPTASREQYARMFREPQAVQQSEQLFDKNIKPDAWQSRGLDKDEALAVYHYTRELPAPGDRGYGDLNKRLREGKADGHTQAFKELLNDGLEKLPVYKGQTAATAMLDVDQAMKKYAPGAVVQERGFVSSTKDFDVAKDAIGNVRFVYESVTGREVRDVSYFAAESEVLFKAGTKFKVLARETDGGMLQVFLREQPGE